MFLLYMCFNYKISLFTFTIGTLFSILLIVYGNKRYSLENKTTGIFLIYYNLKCIIIYLVFSYLGF